MSGLAPWSEPLRPEWIDYNGHLSEGYYVVVFGHATDSVMAQVGMTPEFIADSGTSLFTVEAHIRYLDQIPPGATLEVRSSVIGRGAKTLWLWHEMWLDGRLRATEEVLMLHVIGGEDARATPFPDDIAARLDALRVEPPAEASRSISVR